MTKNQIEYAKLLETRRANRAGEALTANRDEATRQLGLDSLQETARHNQQVELQARDNLAEQYRNNVAQLAELQRSHMSSEGIAMTQATTSYESLHETKRAHQASEQLASDRLELDRLGLSENIRHNKVNEELNLLGQDVSRDVAATSAASHVQSAGISAAASQYASDNALLARQLEIDAQRYGVDVNAGLRMGEIDEAKRSNQARETETNRSNEANERIRAAGVIETVRNNVVNNALNAIRNNADISLRRQQNEIAQQQATTQRKSVEADISLIPSQKFENYARGTQSLSQVASNVSSILSKLKGK